MKLAIIIIIAIAIVLGIYELIHRFMIKRAIRIVQHQAQVQTDRIVSAASQSLFGKDRFSDSKLVADIWGKGVMSFEYDLDLQQMPSEAQEQMEKATFQAAINRCAQKEGVLGFNGAKQPFLITDWWVFEDVLHVDVTYIMNEATAEYVHDLHKLDTDSK